MLQSNKIFRSHPVTTKCIYNATVKHKRIMQVDWNLEHATTSAILKIERCLVLKLLLLYLLITLRHCLLLETQHDFTNLKVVWSNIDAESIIIKIIIIEDKTIETFSPLQEDILLSTSLSIRITSISWKTWHNIYGQFRMTCRIHFIYCCHEKKSL